MIVAAKTPILAGAAGTSGTGLVSPCTSYRSIGPPVQARVTGPRGRLPRPDLRCYNLRAAAPRHRTGGLRRELPLRRSLSRRDERMGRDGFTARKASGSGEGRPGLGSGPMNRLAHETSPYPSTRGTPSTGSPGGPRRSSAPGSWTGRSCCRSIRRLSLVPRDGAGVVRGPRDRRAHERALRLDQGRPGRAPRPRRDLHGRRPGDDRERRVAAHGLPHARRGALLRRHLLPERAAPRDAGVPRGAGGGRRRLGAPPRGGHGAERAHRRGDRPNGAASRPPPSRSRTRSSRRRPRRCDARSTLPGVGSAARRSSPSR